MTCSPSDMFLLAKVVFKSSCVACSLSVGPPRYNAQNGEIDPSVTAMQVPLLASRTHSSCGVGIYVP